MVLPKVRSDPTDTSRRAVVDVSGVIPEEYRRNIGDIPEKYRRNTGESSEP